MIKVGCVIVLYNPDLLLLKKVLDAAILQIECAFISDNSKNPNPLFFRSYGDKVIYHSMGKNAGIAAAQNVGIRYLINNDYSHVFFIDDDSIIAEGTVDKLIEVSKTLEKLNINIGGIGARPYNRQDGKKYQGSINKGSAFSENLTEVSELINTSSLIPTRNFSDVGMFEDRLFIDGVDHEWCWRAKWKKNLRFFITEEILVSHQLGEGDRFFMLRNIAIPSASRTYFQYRNYLILIRRSYVPIRWKIKNGLKYMVKFFYYPIFLKHGNEYFKNIMKGIKDGFLNK